MMELSLRPVAGEKRGEFRFGFGIWEGGNRVVRIMQEAGLFFLLFFKHASFTTVLGECTYKWHFGILGHSPPLTRPIKLSNYRRRRVVKHYTACCGMYTP